MQICPSDDGNTGILVIIDHFSKFAEAVPCSHDEYDAATASRLLLQKYMVPQRKWSQIMHQTSLRKYPRNS